VGFCGIAAHDENQIGILDVDPVIRHRSTAKRRGKTCHRRAVSHTSLVVECQDPKRARNLVRQVADFVARRRCGQHTRGQPPIDGQTFGCLRNEVRVTVLLHQFGNAIEQPAEVSGISCAGIGSLAAYVLGRRGIFDWNREQVTVKNSREINSLGDSI